jgi:hypothetical protein
MDVMDAVVPEKFGTDGGDAPIAEESQENSVEEMPAQDDAVDENDDNDRPTVEVIYDEPTVEVTYDDPIIEETDEDITMTTRRRKTIRTKYTIQEVTFSLH